MKNSTFILFFLLQIIHYPSTANEGQKIISPEFWQQLKTLKGIKSDTSGENIIQIVIFFDANCPQCANLWSYLYGQRSENKKIISLWVPVAYIKKDSNNKAANIIRKNTTQALAYNFENYDFKKRSGAAIPVELDPSIQKTLKQNSSTWEKIMAATPLLIYKTKNEEIFVQTGLPSETKINEILKNLPPSTLNIYKQK